MSRDQGDAAMTYGHAERTLAAIRLLEAETRELLNSLEQLDSEQARWLHDAADSAAHRLQSADPAGYLTHKQAGAR